LFFSFVLIGIMVFIHLFIPNRSLVLANSESPEVYTFVEHPSRHSYGAIAGVGGVENDGDFFKDGIFTFKIYQPVNLEPGGIDGLYINSWKGSTKLPDVAHTDHEKSCEGDPDGDGIEICEYTWDARGIGRTEADRGLIYRAYVQLVGVPAPEGPIVDIKNTQTDTKYLKFTIAGNLTGPSAIFLPPYTQEVTTSGAISRTVTVLADTSTTKVNFTRSDSQNENSVEDYETIQNDTFGATEARLFTYDLDLDSNESTMPLQVKAEAYSSDNSSSAVLTSDAENWTDEVSISFDLTEEQSTDNQCRLNKDDVTAQLLAVTERAEAQHQSLSSLRIQISDYLSIALQDGNDTETKAKDLGNLESELASSIKSLETSSNISCETSLSSSIKNFKENYADYEAMAENYKLMLVDYVETGLNEVENEN
jgi:hypothetical protein